MKNRGNWGLKQARYEISWSELPARCLAVQNSLVKTGTSSAPPRAFAVRSMEVRVFSPNAAKASRSF